MKKLKLNIGLTGNGMAYIFFAEKTNNQSLNEREICDLAGVQCTKTHLKIAEKHSFYFSYFDTDSLTELKEKITEIEMRIQTAVEELKDFDRNNSDKITKEFVEAYNVIKNSQND